MPQAETKAERESVVERVLDLGSGKGVSRAPPATGLLGFTFCLFPLLLYKEAGPGHEWGHSHQLWWQDAVSRLLPHTQSVSSPSHLM